MYSDEIKTLANKVYLVSIPYKFKFDYFDNEIDTLEVYEELFDYAYEIINNLPLVSNFNLFARNKEKIKMFLFKNRQDKDIGNICSVCFEFCVAISDLLI